MAHCCSCRPSNGGSCRGCKCTKAQLKCSNCLCGIQGQCGNPFNTQDQEEWPLLSSPKPPAPQNKRPQRITRPPKFHDDLLKTEDELTDEEVKHNKTETEIDDIDDEKDEVKEKDSFDSPQAENGLPALEESLFAEDHLPPYMHAAKPDFKWSERSGEDFCKDINAAYEVVSLWRKNVFKLPSNATGKKFVQELVKLNWAYADRTPLESIAQKAEMVMTPLLLQRSHSKSKPQEDLACLKRRLELWQRGDIKALLKEGKDIQSRLESSLSRDSDDTIARKFATMMLNGNGKSAMRYVVNQAKGGVLKLDEATKQQLYDKHPRGEAAAPEALMKGAVPENFDPIVFSALDGSMVKKCALQTEGAAGVSQADDQMWHKMVTSFKETSTDFCAAVAAVARRFSTEYVDPQGVEALVANRGIPLDKCPGLRPVGIGEVKRRVMGKAIMQIVGFDVQGAVGSLNLCAGQSAGVEAAVHAMRHCFAADEVDAVLLIDADNAFNRINRHAILNNIQYICPIFKHAIINTYRTPSRIFVLGGMEMTSEEGTTQGCPLAMAIYALALVPLANQLHGICKQVWFADDGTGADKVDALRKWWDMLLEKGPSYGYFPKAAKTWLIVKEDKLEEAKHMFKDTGVKITSDGMRHLGAAIGSKDFKDSYVLQKIQEWIDSVERLAKIAVTEPQAAFSAFIERLQSRWVFMVRTIPDLAKAMQPLEDAIRQKFIPALLGRTVNDLERELFSLPARFAGLGIANPCTQSEKQFKNSEELTAPLLELILAQDRKLNAKHMRKTQDCIREIQKNQTEADLDGQLRKIEGQAPNELKIAIEQACEKGASSWVTARPRYSHPWTVLHKGEFRDAIYLRYGWEPPKLPEKCGCGASFNVAHAMQCMLGGFRGLMHNEVNYVFYDTAKQAGFKDVVMEPQLQELSGESFKYKSANKDEEARSDLQILGFWSRQRRAFFDITAFSPFARSYKNKSLSSCFTMHEKRKKREYQERLRNVEHADFTPLVIATTGGIGPEGSMMLKRLAQNLAEKREMHISVVAGWLRCRLSFAILRSALICLRGSRPFRPKDDKADDAIDLAVNQCRIDY